MKEFCNSFVTYNFRLEDLDENACQPLPNNCDNLVPTNNFLRAKRTIQIKEFFNNLICKVIFDNHPESAFFEIEPRKI